jgi:collagenase-like PrtC family protease
MQTWLYNRQPEDFKNTNRISVEGILDLGVDSLTVSLPSLMEIINKHFPGTKIKVSTYQKVDSVAMAKKFEELGADVIMLSELINRDFKRLQAIRRSVKCKLALIANAGCLHGCPNIHCHSTSCAHSGSKGENNTIFSEYYQATCTFGRVSNPVELIRARWIRPEDVKVYEDIGIDMLKILERNSKSDSLGERVKAYSERKYEGNLVDILGQIINSKHAIGRDLGESGLSNEEFVKAGRFIKTFFWVNLSNMYYIDNTKIPKNFIDSFMGRDCSKLSCEECKYCESILNQCKTKKNSALVESTLKSMKALKEEIIEGSILY